jgi:hypothetical protein
MKEMNTSGDNLNPINKPKVLLISYNYHTYIIFASFSKRSPKRRGPSQSTYGPHLMFKNGFAVIAAIFTQCTVI